MVRLGVLEAQGEAILGSAKPNSAYFARSEHDLREWANEVNDAFKRGPDAIYGLALKIFKSKTVNELISNGDFPSQPEPTALDVENHISNKHAIESDSDSDGEHRSRRMR